MAGGADQAVSAHPAPMTINAAIRDLEAKRAEIDTSLNELRLINQQSRQALDAKRSRSKAAQG